MIVSWKMRRVMGKDVKWAGFDMEIWTGPSDRTCSQPQLGKRSLPSPAFLHQHCSSGLKLCETEEGSAVGRCLPYCCHCVAAVAQLCTAQAVIADAVPVFQVELWLEVCEHWGLGQTKVSTPEARTTIIIVQKHEVQALSWPVQKKKKKKEKTKQSCCLPGKGCYPIHTLLHISLTLSIVSWMRTVTLYYPNN